MKPIFNRKDFERNIDMLVEFSRAGKINFAPAARDSITSLLNIKMLPNARVNFNTVDESARNTANSVANIYAHRVSDENHNDEEAIENELDI